MEIDTRALSRRGLVAGGAAIGTGALLSAATGSLASAAPTGGGPLGGPGRTLDGEPGVTRLGSAPIGGYTYLHRSFMDFHTYLNGPWTWSSAGVYGGAGEAGYMLSGLDLPAGAILRDIEWYYSATGAGALGAYLWSTGSAQLTTVSTLGVNTTGLAAARTVVASSVNGPYTLGVRLLLLAFTNGGVVKLNGARVGFSSLPTGTVMLPAPVRAYDSRSGAKIGNGQTRIHSLASYIPAGATAAIVNLTATSGEKSGGLAIYNTGSPLPSGSLLYYNGGTTESNEVHCKLPSDRKVKVTMRGVSGCKTHYFIDVLGYTA